MATLKVTVHEARDLPIMDRTTGLADPYVVVKLDDMEHTTDIARRTRNPVWAHDVRFDTADLLVLQEDPLEIRVYDHDIISRDDIVGMVLLDCNSIIYRDNPFVSGWFPLIDSDAGLRGDIRLTIRIKFHAAENPLAPALPERYVRRLDPRVAEQQLPTSSPSPPAMAASHANVANEVSVSLPTMPSVVSSSAVGELNFLGQALQRSASNPLDQGNVSSLPQHSAFSQNSSGSAAATTAAAAGGPAGAAATNTAATTLLSPGVPHSKMHSAFASRQVSVAQPSRSQSLQPNSASVSPFFNLDTPFTALANAGATLSMANSLNPGISGSTAMNYADNVAAVAAGTVPLPSPALLPFLVEQDLDPLQAARVDHPTLAAEEEGVFVFSVWRLDPAVFRVESTHSMMEELIVKSDPEHVRFTNLRSSRSINDARVIQLFKLSGKVRRQLARKVVELQCNAVLGYVEEFDIEPNGIIVRAYGTPCVVSRVKYVDEQEMQHFLRRKTRYLQSSLVSAAYQGEFAQQQQQQMSSAPLSQGASPLLSGGGGGDVAGGAAGVRSPISVVSPGGNGSLGGPTYYTPPFTIHPRLSVCGSTPLMPATPPITSPSHYTVTATNNNNNDGVSGAPTRDHLLPPATTSDTNDSVMAEAQMPPETTSTAVQSPATTPVHGPADPATATAVLAGPTSDNPTTMPDLLVLDDNNGCTAPAAAEEELPGAVNNNSNNSDSVGVARHNCYDHTATVAGQVRSASLTSPPPSDRSVAGASFGGAVVNNGSTDTAVVSQSPLQQQQQQQQSASQVNVVTRSGPPENGGSGGGVAALPPPVAAAAVNAVLQQPQSSAAAAPLSLAAVDSVVTGPSRVIISMLTVKDLPAGAIHHIGGYICARSVKIVSRVKSRQMISQERDAWWMELREELRANARAFHCNTVLGYEEETQYYEDVVLLSLYGTAVMLDVSVTSLRAGPEYLFRLQRQRVAARRNCTLLHLYEGPRRKGGQQGLGLLTGEVGDLLLHHVCSICHNKPVPEVLLAACTLPVELSCEAPPRLVQVAVAKTKPNAKGVELAMAVSQALPFIEFALHKQLLFNLRLQQMNACFSLRVSIVIGPDAIIGTLTGSGCRLAGLPVPRLPRMTVVDPLIANQESVVKLRDVIASRHRRHYSGTRSSSSSSSSSSRSSSSTSSSSSSSSSSRSRCSSSASSATAGSNRLTTPQSALVKKPEGSGDVARTGSTDDVRAAVAAAALQQQPQLFNASSAVTPNTASLPTSASTSKRRKQHQQQQRQQGQKSKRSRRKHRSRHHKRSNKHSNESSVSSHSPSEDSSRSAEELSHSASSSAGASLSSNSNNGGGGGGVGAPEERAKKHRRKRRHHKHHRNARNGGSRNHSHTNNNSHEVNSNTSVAAADEGNVKRTSHTASDAATKSTSTTTQSSATSTSTSTSSRSSSRSRSSSSSSSHSSASSSSSPNSWVPTEPSESDEDVYAPADEWHSSGGGVRTKANDYVVRIDDVEEADMMLGMVDSTSFEDGVLLTLPYVPDSANAFDWQERIVLDRRYSRASTPPFSGGGGGPSIGGLSDGSMSGAMGGYGSNASYGVWAGNSGSAFATGNAHSDGGQGGASGAGAEGGGGGAAMSHTVAVAGRTALSTRLLNEYCADAKRAFVHRACRIAMRTSQPLRLRVVSLRMEMMFVPNSADLQLRLEGCVMVASSVGARQLRALEDRAFRVCMHYTMESLSGLWHYHHQQQQLQLQSHTSHSNANTGGGSSGPLTPAPRLSTSAPLVTTTNVSGSGRATPSLPWGANTPILSPMAGTDALGYSASNDNPSLSSPPQPQQQQSVAASFVVPHSGSSVQNLAALAAAAAAAAAVTGAGSTLSTSCLLPLATSGPAYLDARRLFITCNAPFSMPYVQDITLPPPRVWSGVATAFSEDMAAASRHTSTYAEYRDSRGSRTTSLARRWHAFVRATGQSIKGLVDRATGGAGDRIDWRLQQQRRWLSSTADGSSTSLRDGAAGSNSNANGPIDPSMAGLRDANYGHPAARLPQNMSQLLQLIPVVLFTPLDYVAGRSIVRYLGRLSQHFIREDFNTQTSDDLNVFFQRAEMEMMCMVQAVVRLMGGNALLKHRVVYHEICDSDGSGSAFLFATVTGDVVQVSDTEYWGSHTRDAHARRRHSAHQRTNNNNNNTSREGSSDEDGSTPWNNNFSSRTRYEDVTEGSDADRSSSTAAAAGEAASCSRRRKVRRGASRHRSNSSNRRHGSRARRHRRRHRCPTSSSSSSSSSRRHGNASSSSSSSSSSATTSHTVSSSTTAHSGAPTPSRGSSVPLNR